MRKILLWDIATYWTDLEWAESLRFNFRKPLFYSSLSEKAKDNRKIVEYNCSPLIRPEVCSRARPESWTQKWNWHRHILQKCWRTSLCGICHTVCDWTKNLTSFLLKKESGQSSVSSLTTVFLKTQENSSIVFLFQVLLVTSSRRPETWIVPGGGVEPEETPSVTAMREVLEEAGVVGKLGRSLGVFEVRWELRRLKTTGAQAYSV